MENVPLCGGCDNSDTGDCEACLRHMEYVKRRYKPILYDRP